MQFYFLYSGCGANEQTEVAKASQARKPELDAKASRVGVLPSTPVVVAVEYSQAEPRWLMRASFYCERGTASAETRSNEMLDSLDNLINELSEQIDQQLERPLPAPQRRHRLSGFDSFLEAFRQDEASSHFASVLTPVLASLDRYIRRELRVRRALGELPAHQTTLQEVRDEVLARAWDRFEQRPRQRPLDAWLIGLIEETIEDLAKPAAEAPEQQAEAPQQQQPAAETAEPPTQAPPEDQQASEEDATALAELIAQRPEVQPWKELDIGGRHVRMDRLMRRLPRSQRQALMLQAVDGFSAAEIADLQDRAEHEVAADLAAAKEEVRKMFTEDDYREIEESLVREGLERPRRSHRR